MNILAIIPARGGSKGIPKKNIINLDGKPLITYSIITALKSKYIDKIVVSTDDEEISRVSKEAGASVIKRPTELSLDNSKMDGVIKHVLLELEKERYIPALVVLLQPTSPLRTAETVDQAIKSFLEEESKFDSLTAVFPISNKIGIIKNGFYCPKLEMGKQRQELEKFYKECGTIFIFKPNIINTDKFFGNNVYPFIITNLRETVDVDTYDDLKLAKFFIKSEK